MVERNVDWELLFVALVLTVTVVAGMFYMGVELSEQRTETLAREVEQLTVQRHAQDLSLQLARDLPTNNCRALNVAVRERIEEIEELGDQVELYEQTQKLGKDRFDVLKKRYTNLLLEYYLSMEQVEDTCSTNITKIIYIYANPDDCPSCEDQGKVLTKYRQTYDDNLLVFPLDAELGLSPVNVLLEAYGADRFPVLIIDETMYQGFHGKQALADVLEQHMNLSKGVP